MLTRSIRGRLRRTLPVTKYLSSAGFGVAILAAQCGSSAAQASEKPRQRRNRSVTRRSVKPSTRDCCPASPVKFRNGITPTAMLGGTQGHCGNDSSVRGMPRFRDNGFSGMSEPLTSIDTCRALWKECQESFSGRDEVRGRVPGFADPARQGSKHPAHLTQLNRRWRL